MVLILCFRTIIKSKELVVQTSSSALQQGLHNRQPLESYPYSSLALFMTPPAAWRRPKGGRGRRRRRRVVRRARLR
jgi:hypothetical protein